MLCTSDNLIAWDMFCLHQNWSLINIESTKKEMWTCKRSPTQFANNVSLSWCVKEKKIMKIKKLGKLNGKTKYFTYIYSRLQSYLPWWLSLTNNCIQKTNFRFFFAVGVFDLDNEDWKDYDRKELCNYLTWKLRKLNISKGSISTFLKICLAKLGKRQIQQNCRDQQTANSAKLTSSANGKFSKFTAHHWWKLLELAVFIEKIQYFKFQKNGFDFSK